MVFPLLFAFGFGASAMLPALGAASIPIILHLLNKRKYREMQWAAMHFLLAAIRKNQRRIRLEQLILLAVRTALIIFLVLAMAKPFLESAGALPALAGRRTHRVIALDASMSMKTTAAGETRFAKAKEVARRLVEGSKRGDSLSVVLLGSPPKIVVGDPSPNRDEVLKELNEVVATDGDLDVGAGFQAIDRVLDSSDIPRKEVVVLTDLQAASWRQADGKKLDDSLKRVLDHFKAREVASVVIDLGETNVENVAVTRVDLNSPIVTLGSTQAVTATLRNFGRSNREINAKLIVDEQEIGRQTVELKPGDEQPVSFTQSFSTPGDHVVEVQIDDDPLAPTTTADLSCRRASRSRFSWSTAISKPNRSPPKPTIWRKRSVLPRAARREIRRRSKSNGFPTRDSIKATSTTTTSSPFATSARSAPRSRRARSFSEARRRSRLLLRRSSRGEELQPRAL